MLYTIRINSANLFANCTAMLLKQISKTNLHYRNPTLLNNFMNKNNKQIRNQSIFRWYFKKDTIEQLKIKDNISDQCELIYRNGMSKYLLCGQIFSTVFAGFVCLGIIIDTDLKNLKLKQDIFKRNVGTSENEMYIYLVAFIGLCVAMQSVISKMPLRIYNLPKQNEYIMIFYGALPATRRRLTYTVNQVVHSEGGILPWKSNTYEITNKGKVILMDQYFRRPADLNIMLGYQKHSDD